MKQLKVTWQDGGWNRDGVQPTATAFVPADDLQTVVVGETLVFRKIERNNPVGGQVYLIVPESRLISAIVVEGETSNG